VAPMEDVARELGLLIRSLKALHHAVLTDVGVRVELPAAAVLSTLADAGQLRPSALAERLHLDLSSISRQAAALEREGWVSRERDPDDSRATLLELTPTGHDVLARVRAGRVAQLCRLLPEWSDAELADFAGQLHRFRTDLTRSAPDPAGPAGPAEQPGIHQRTTTRHPMTDRPTDRTPALAGQET